MINTNHFEHCEEAVTRWADIEIASGFEVCQQDLLGEYIGKIEDEVHYLKQKEEALATEGKGLTDSERTQLQRMEGEG